MRIAFVVTGGLHPSGSEQIVPSWIDLLEQLARRHEVHAFALHHLPEAQTYSLAGATVHDLGRPADGARLRLPAMWHALARALNGVGRVDVLHAFWPNPAGVIVATMGRRRGVPTVVTCDTGEFVALPGLDYGLQSAWRGRAMVALACRAATRVHVCSGYMEQLARACGIETMRIPLGIDRTRFPGAPPAPPGPPWRLLQVASLNAVKDQRMLLDAVARVRATHDVRLDLVGEDTLSGHVQQHAAELGLRDVVTFHGFRTQAELRPLFAAAHLYVQSSRHEAAGVSVLEAAAMGVPTVGTRVGYVADWAPAAATATPPGDAPALGAAITTLLDDGEARHRLGAAAQAMAYDVRDTAPRFEQLYESIAPSHSEHTQR